MASDIEARLQELERQYKSQQRQISGMRRLLTEHGIVPKANDGQCILGNDPTDCPAAKPYRYQKGCRAEACMVANSAYYSKSSDEPEPTPVEPPKKKALVRRATPA